MTRLCGVRRACAAATSSDRRRQMGIHASLQTARAGRPCHQRWTKSEEEARARDAWGRGARRREEVDGCRADRVPIQDSTDKTSFGETCWRDISAKHAAHPEKMQFLAFLNTLHARELIDSEIR
eukprot:1937285-Pleurochrysis_carterae.AAC.1